MWVIWQKHHYSYHITIYSSPSRLQCVSIAGGPPLDSLQAIGLGWLKKLKGNKYLVEKWHTDEYVKRVSGSKSWRWPRGDVNVITLISAMDLPRICCWGLQGPVYTESRVSESGFIFHTDRIFHCVHMEPGSEKFACTRAQRDPAGRRGAFTVSRRNEHSVSRMVSRVKPTNYGV